MEIRRNHWLKASGLAIVLHAAVLIGLRTRTVGEASPAAGPVIEMATALPGVIGSIVQDIDVVSPDKIEETGEPEKTDVEEPTEPEIQKSEPESAEPEARETEPVITRQKPVVKKKKRRPSRASGSSSGLTVHHSLVAGL